MVSAYKLAETLIISGLPTNAAVGPMPGTMQGVSLITYPAGTTSIVPSVQSGGKTIQIWANGTGNAGSYLTTTATPTGVAQSFRLTGFYFV